VAELKSFTVTERLLQFIWQFQYFNKSELVTDSGEELHVIFPGHYNTNQGPDFSDAKIRIGNTIWAGTVELHIKTSGWEKHLHQLDKNYNNVILHVVWEDDHSDSNIPVLELKTRVSKILLQRYNELMNTISFIPCEKSIGSIPEITWKSWKDRLLAERLLRKALTIDSSLQQNNYHWEETFWWLLARNFGTKVNSDAFEAVARSIPFIILNKEKHQLQRIESLLLGQAGLLVGEFEEDYPQLLQREYRFLQKKHKLRQAAQPLHFLRMRPGNFPTVRLAQLAVLIHSSEQLFAKLKETGSARELREWFDITANDYWHYHYRFDETSVFKKKKLGMTMVDNIIINTVVPVLFAFGNYHKEQKYMDKALRWLEETGPESNTVIDGFRLLGIENESGYDSQGLIELKTQYCDKKRCLDCAIGNYLLKDKN
jgi:hypothetical protein